MKRIILTLIALQPCMSFFAQEFSTEFYFETAQGERDTLVLGYDATATQGIDELFGETDYGSPISPNKFQAFIIEHGGHWYGNSPFHSKKQIVNAYAKYNRIIEIIVPFESLPLTISWDKTQFEDSNREYSLITDWPSGGWFDAIPAWNTILQYMKDNDSIVFPGKSDSEILEAKDYGYPYKDELDNQIHFYVIYVGFRDYEEMHVGISKINANEKFCIYPNPVIDICHIEKSLTGSIRQVQLFSVSGTKIISTQKETMDIDCRGLSKGVYILSIETKDNKKNYYKLIKK